MFPTMRIVLPRNESPRSNCYIYLLCAFIVVLVVQSMHYDREERISKDYQRNVARANEIDDVKRKIYADQLPMLEDMALASGYKVEWRSDTTVRNEERYRTLKAVMQVSTEEVELEAEAIVKKIRKVYTGTWSCFVAGDKVQHSSFVQGSDSHTNIIHFKFGNYDVMLIAY